MSRLFIAEKPDLARAIVDGLDGGTRQGNYYQCGDDIVTWCIGHMLELCEPADFDERYKKWNLDDLPIKTPIKYKPKSKTKEQLETVLELIKEADTIVHAGDNDAEGQLIVDELLEYAGNTKPVLRFLTNDNNTKIVKKALANMKDNSKYHSLYQAALARNIGDQRYGFNMSRLYTVLAQKQGYDGVLSVGRVQTPILGLVVNRDRAHANHEKQYYYDIMGEFAIEGQLFPAKHIPAEDAPVDDKKRINDKDYADGIAKACHDQKATVTKVDSKIKKASAPLPYNMLKLQADAAKAFNYKPDQVMQITQELREKHRLITYNGSDCQYLNEEQHEDAPNVLAAIAETATEYQGIVSKADASIKSRAFNNKNVTAHHAIIPTEATANLDELSEPLRNIYLLIAKKYIAQFYPKHEYRETVIHVDVCKHLFGVKSNITLDEGWRVLFSKTNDDEEDNEAISLDLSVLKDNDEGKCTKAEVLDKETKPPKLYTMATLLEDLTRVAKYIKDPDIKALLIDKDKDKKEEHGGIGTSRTRDQIIKKLFNLNFIAEKGKSIISTDLGKKFFDALPSIATSPDMTALWHEQQAMIEQGDNTCEKFLDELMVFIEKQINSTKENGYSINVQASKKLSSSCPKCNGTINVIGGGKPRYACNDCDFIVWGVIAGRKLSVKEADKLIKDKKIDKLEGFVSKAKKKFSAGLEMDVEDDYKVKFVFEKTEDSKTDSKTLEALCPKCEGKINVIGGSKPRYSCGGCDFIVWGAIAGRNLTIEEAEKLIKDKKIDALDGFTSKKKTKFSAGLKLDLDKNKVDFVFN